MIFCKWLEPHLCWGVGYAVKSHHRKCWSSRAYLSFKSSRSSFNLIMCFGSTAAPQRPYDYIFSLYITSFCIIHESRKLLARYKNSLYPFAVSEDFSLKEIFRYSHCKTFISWIKRKNTISKLQPSSWWFKFKATEVRGKKYYHSHPGVPHQLGVAPASIPFSFLPVRY